MRFILAIALALCLGLAESRAQPYTQLEAEGQRNAGISAGDANWNALLSAGLDYQDANSYYTSVGLRWAVVLSSMTSTDIDLVFDYLSGANGYLYMSDYYISYATGLRDSANYYSLAADTAYHNSDWSTSYVLFAGAIDLYEDSDIAFNEAVIEAGYANGFTWSAEYIIALYE